MPPISGGQGWSLTMLGSDAACPAGRSSYGLLEAVDPLGLSHAGQDATLGSGDFAIVDLRLPLRIVAADTPAAARLLDLGDRMLDRQIGAIARVLGQCLPGGDPVGATAGKLLGQLQSLQTLGYGGLGDGLVATIVALLPILASRTAPAGRTLHTAAMLQRAQGIIAAQLGDPRLRVTGVAERLGISSRHLSALFEVTGQSPSEYIATLRMNRARALLADSSQSRHQIAEVAMACGFDDQSHFSRCFKAHAGTSPRAFREASARTQDVA